ncbi:hypothetical protein PRZ48_002540 [Zasmidium cellare]|uniref:Multicopper oxidase n=1 Tax=Zasmidium cellare TaxID=395010 RepID=A0ABR0F4C8_ZASCE|nr:hypothetical protein PRZ48_002540 [Zasmidium cellare]
MEKDGKWKRKWKVILPTAAVLATVVLFFFLYPKFYLNRSWSDEDLYSGDNPEIEQDLGHGPVTHPAVEPNDFSIRLHPEQHIHRDPETIGLEWNITKGVARPDGVAKEVYLIDGQFPGPTVELRSGDELLVTIRNELKDEGVAIHWHGLRIENAMDGVVGLTQCAIQKEFTYRLKIPDDQDGTFWYHSHSELQRADGLFGALVIHKPAEAGSTSDLKKYEYRNEQLLMVGDWYHRPAEEVLADYTNWENFKIEPAPDSMLLNGVGYFECSMATKAHPLDCKGQDMPHLTLPARTRLRIVNTGALTGFTISMTGFVVTLLEVDGGHGVEQVRSEKVGILYPGERVDLLVERSGHDEYESAWITIALDRENMQFPNMALTPTQQFSIAPPMANERAVLHEEATVRSISPHVPWIDLSNVNGSAIAFGELSGQSADDTILLYASISYLTQYEYRPKGFINHTSWSLSNSSGSPLLSLDRAAWPTDPEPLVVKAGRSEWVDLVINNIDDKGHPFHLHGHDFYVLSVHQASRVGAYEQYNPFDSEKEPAGGPMNLVNPVIKDTVYIPSQGYAVLRFRASNLGLWLVHCHVLWHEAVGMNMAIQIGDDAQVRSQMVQDSIAKSCAG